MRFICNGFSIKLVKIAQKVDLVTCLTSDATHESHMRSIRGKCQIIFRESLRNSGQIASDRRNSMLGTF